MAFIIEQYKLNRALRYSTIFFGVMTLWWLYMYFTGIREGVQTTWFLLLYPLITAVGGMYGLVFAKKWGGFKSTFGSSIALFAFGLLAQTAGQYLYNYYQIYLGIDAPYPSIGDFFYFASVLLYIIAAYKLIKVSGFKLTIDSLGGKLKAIIIPALILFGSYWLLLRGYEFSEATPLIIFLDFGWLIGNALYVGIAILALLISKNILGGLMRAPIMLLIIALVAQFLADFVFSYQVSGEVVSYYPGGPNDYLYFLGYFLMTYALFAIGNMFYKVQDS